MRRSLCRRGPAFLVLRATPRSPVGRVGIQRRVLRILRWTYNRRWSAAVGGRTFGYDTTSTDGYFAPKRYTLAEGSIRGRVGGNLGWNAEGDAGLGNQRIQLFGASTTSRLAERAALSAGLPLRPGA